MKQRVVSELPPQTEEEWEKTVEDCAHKFLWRAYHTRFSLGSSKGFPDWVFCKPPRLLFVELKSETGKTTPEQELWLMALKQIPGVEVYLWRPSDFREVVRVLSGGQAEGR